MATPPDFSPGQVLTAAHMDAVGLWLVKTQTVGTGVSSVTVTGAFSADYANYRITWTGGTLSTATNVRMVLGAAATGYYSQLIYQQYNATTAPLANVPDNNAVRWNFVGSGTANFVRLVMNIYNPFATTRTLMDVDYVNDLVAGHGGGLLDNATSYSDFTLSLGTVGATMTGGTIRVYGYRN